MRLTDRDVQTRLSACPGWREVDGAIERQFTFDTFPYAVAFVTTLGVFAESRDHHPEIHISYKRVTITWTTHSAKGLTEKDFVGARESDRLARAMGASIPD